MPHGTQTDGANASAKMAESRRQLAELEGQLEQAAPESLDFDFWTRVLETVESLPLAEEIAWKQQHLTQLRLAVRSRTDELDDEESS